MMPTQQQSLLKSYIKQKLRDVKHTDSSRGLYHVRFSYDGDEKSLKKYLDKYHIEIIEWTSRPISSKFETHQLVLKKTINKSLPAGTTLPWVNNNIGQASKGKTLFNNKDLSPDALNLAGKTYNSVQIIQNVEKTLRKKYDENVANELIQMLKLCNTKRANIPFKTSFDTKDLAKVSADFGEIMSAVWIQNNLGFKRAIFPSVSNEKLIDIYGQRFNIEYPVSVKSGGGGKVTVQNIVESLEKKSFEADKFDLKGEPAYWVFKMVNELSMREQMIELHKYMETDAIKELSKIININYKKIDLPTVKKWTDSMDNKTLSVTLEPFWQTLNMNLTDRIKEGPDKLRLIISPLGESIWKILNEDKEIKKSLTNVARKLTIIQVNVDVRKTGISFKNNYFKKAKFEFGWAGYTAGNKLGFKMKIT